jgi:hypothetical protein
MIHCNHICRLCQCRTTYLVRYRDTLNPRSACASLVIIQYMFELKVRSTYQVAPFFIKTQSVVFVKITVVTNDFHYQSNMYIVEKEEMR